MLAQANAFVRSDITAEEESFSLGPRAISPMKLQTAWIMDFIARNPNWAVEIVLLLLVI